MPVLLYVDQCFNFFKSSKSFHLAYKSQRLNFLNVPVLPDQNKNEENDDTEESEDSDEEKVEENTESDKGQTCDKVQLPTGQRGQDGNGEDEDR